MKIRILAIGRNDEILQTVIRLINSNEQWEGIGVMQDSDAIQLFDKSAFDLVLLCNGISKNAEDILCRYFRDKNPSIKIIQHYGGGSGLLSNEIIGALNDNAL